MKRRNLFSAALLPLSKFVSNALFLFFAVLYKNSVLLNSGSVCANGDTEDVKIYVGLKQIKIILGRPRLWTPKLFFKERRYIFEFLFVFFLCYVSGCFLSALLLLMVILVLQKYLQNKWLHLLLKNVFTSERDMMQYWTSVYNMKLENSGKHLFAYCIEMQIKVSWKK